MMTGFKDVAVGLPAATVDAIPTVSGAHADFRQCPESLRI
jgi:hypothetical protein